MTTTVSTRTRIAWLDVARGTAVLAVVLAHTQGWLFAPFSDGRTVWDEIVSALYPYRLPALFLISGMLTASKIRPTGSTRAALWSAARSYYLYVVWLLIFVLAAALRFSTGAPQLSGTPAALILPRTVLWFVFALAFWTLVLVLARRVPKWLVLTGLTVISSVALALPGNTRTHFYLQVLTFGVVFAVGVYFKEAIMSLVTRFDARLLVAALALFIAARIGVPLARDLVEGTALEGASLMAPLRHVPGAIIACYVVAVFCSPRVSWAWNWLRYVGTQTLPIYVMHVLVISAILRVPGWGKFASSAPGQWIGPVLTVAVVTGITLAAHAILARTPGRVLFRLPMRERAGV